MDSTEENQLNQAGLTPAQAAVISLINSYRHFPQLWKVKAPEYHDRNLKNSAYQVVLQEYQKYDNTMTKEGLKKKINSLRTAYRKELKKVIESSKPSGNGTKQIYKPTLYYYDEMLFLRDQEEEAEPSISTLQPLPESIMHDDDDEELVDNPSEPEPHGSSTPTSVPSSSSSSSSNVKRLQTKKKSMKRKADDLLSTKELELLTELTAITKNSNRRSDDNEVIDPVAASWNYQLRAIKSEQQRILAEKIISDTLFAARLNKLTESSMLIESTVETLIQEY